jgi:sterol desaturase/sphingolipid hydroxylase (fatty acid hydroxylase superfamily)
MRNSIGATQDRTLVDRTLVDRTWVEDRPGLLRLFGARHPLFSLLFAVPLAALLLALAWRPERGAGAIIIELAAGVAYWTFFEYALHRWFYHWRPRRLAWRRAVESFHVYHHRDVADRRVYNAGPLLALPVTLLLAGPVLALTFSRAATATVMMGTLGSYQVYEWFHHAFHVRVHAGGWLGYMQRFHLLHHDHDWRANFGVTNPVWDLIFGTARSPAPVTTK